MSVRLLAARGNCKFLRTVAIAPSSVFFALRFSDWLCGVAVDEATAESSAPPSTSPANAPPPLRRRRRRFRLRPRPWPSLPGSPPGALLAVVLSDWFCRSPSSESSNLRCCGLFAVVTGILTEGGLAGLAETATATEAAWRPGFSVLSSLLLSLLELSSLLSSLLPVLELALELELLVTVGWLAGCRWPDAGPLLDVWPVSTPRFRLR